MLVDQERDRGRIVPQQRAGEASQAFERRLDNVGASYSSSASWRSLRASRAALARLRSRSASAFCREKLSAGATMACPLPFVEPELPAAFANRHHKNRWTNHANSAFSVTSLTPEGDATH